MTAASSDVNSKIKRDRPETNGQLQEIAVKAEMVRFNLWNYVCSYVTTIV